MAIKTEVPSFSYRIDDVGDEELEDHDADAGDGAALSAKLSGEHLREKGNGFFKCDSIKILIVVFLLASNWNCIPAWRA